MSSKSPAAPLPPIQAITLDLDDTLWPVAPVIRRAERVMMDWLAQQAPATIARHDREAWATLRRAVVAERPDWAHDFSALRRETVRRALEAAGDDPALAGPAFELFLAERQKVELYADALPALARLAARWPVVALSNGNADVKRVPGLAVHFTAAVSARELGLGKPAPEAFLAACARAGSPPAATLHVGDDAELDVAGALAAGLQAAWVRRPDAPPQPPGAMPPAAHWVVPDLTELADRLGA